MIKNFTLCNIIAKKTITSTSGWDVVAAAPNATPSTAACTTRPKVAVTLFCLPSVFLAEH